MEERSNLFHGRDGHVFTGRGVGNRTVAVPLSRRKNGQRNGHGTRAIVATVTGGSPRISAFLDTLNQCLPDTNF